MNTRSSIHILVLAFLINSAAEAGPRLKSFASSEISISSLQNRSRLFLGGRFGWTINDQYMIAGGFYSLLPRSPLSSSITSRSDSMNVIYGGPHFGYTLWRTDSFELLANVMVGIGGLGMRSRDPRLEGRRYDTFFVAQSDVTLLINLARSFRVFIGGSYRYVSGINSIGYSDEFLTKPAAVVGLFFSL